MENKTVQSLVEDDMIQQIKIPKDTTKKSLEVISEFNKVVGY